MADRRVGLVSGANRGIGREVARQLAEKHGLLVFAGARDPGKVDLAGSVVPLPLDVADPASVEAATQRIEADPGRLDVLVNNAGVYGPASGAARVDPEQAHEVLETNLFGAWRLAQAALPLLRRSNEPESSTSPREWASSSKWAVATPHTAFPRPA